MVLFGVRVASGPSVAIEIGTISQCQLGTAQGLAVTGMSNQNALTTSRFRNEEVCPYLRTDACMPLRC